MIRDVSDWRGGLRVACGGFLLFNNIFFVQPSCLTKCQYTPSLETPVFRVPITGGIRDMIFVFDFILTKYDYFPWY